MKRAVFFIIGLSLLISACYLIPEGIATPTNDLVSDTVIVSPATPTPVIEDSPISTETAVPELTLTIKPTSIGSPTNTLSPSVTPTELPYTLQPGNPAYIENFAHPSDACDWLGVAGQVFNDQGEPMVKLVAFVKGKLGSKEIDKVAVTGIPEADIYNPGAYEIQIAQKPIASNETLSIQIFDINGNPISEEIFFNTLADCTKNLIIMNFIEK